MCDLPYCSEKGRSIMNNLESDLDVRMNVTGVVFSYYYICHRKMWLFAKGLSQENISGNPDVVKGELLHESRFKRQVNKELEFDRVKIDFIKFGDQVYVHEIKKSKKFEEAHIWQLKYYIYNLRARESTVSRCNSLSCKYAKGGCSIYSRGWKYD